MRPERRNSLFALWVVFVASLFVGGPATGAGAAEKPVRDYERDRWNPIHFKPAIEKATDKQCLSCHKEILKRRVQPRSPAGLRASKALAWYQTLKTYSGPQDTFHRRHLVTPVAKRLMKLACNFCHQGHDPREEAPAPASGKAAGFTLRKQVDPQATCLRCHGTFPYKLMTLDGPWPKVRGDLEDKDTPNGCLACHKEQFRTVRHQVTYLRPKAIEAAAKKSSDVCYGCHGGRAWYRIAYPFPRHPWPDMEKEVPDWAKKRPTKSDPRFRIKAKN